ncbi:hypothetical protein ACHQM5_001439 [Ranunculus cassubicifolius]
MATSFATLLSIISFISLLTTCLSRCHPVDYSALMKIKKGFNKPNVLSSWAPKTDCCSCYAITCDQINNRVIGFSLRDAEISGQIPWAIGIPSFLAGLANLEILELDHNEFSGVIPNTLFLFTKLKLMRLDRNKLIGTIPEPIGPFVGNVPSLNFAHNQLHGPLPKAFATMDFKRIDLSQNILVGDATPLFKPHGSTEILNISYNMFEFDFSKLEFPKSMFSLFINRILQIRFKN